MRERGGEGKKRGKKERWRGMGLGGREAWVLRRAGPQDLILITLDRHECF